MTDAILEISDGTTTISLINPSNGFHLVNWIPAITDYKGGGIFQNPPLADWRQLRERKWATAQENMGLHINGSNPDNAANILQKLRQLLEKANQYWTTDWQNDPVWLRAKAKCETNSRYMIIVKGRLANDGNQFQQPFTGQVTTMQNLPLQIERRAWLANQPGIGTATNISTVEHYDNQWCIDFSNAGDEIDCGSDAGIDDLPSGASGFTAEAWIKPRTSGASAGGRIFDKNQWLLSTSEITNNLSLFASIAAAATNAQSRPVNTLSLYDGNFHHVAITYDDGAASRVIRIWIDGIETSYALQQAASGALTSDAASTLFIGENSGGTRNFDGCIAWCRLSDTVRYTGKFIPSELCNPPAVDGNTVAQWNMIEGKGATVDNAEGTAARDGTLTGADWASDVAYDECGRAYGNVDSSGDREVTTENEVYIANKHNLANITDIYNFDDSLASFSSNLMDAALPTTLFPSPAGVDDIIYFGIDTALPDSGPFSSLVSDIATIAESTTSFALIWEYWNGAWAALTVQDNTDSFQLSGVNSVHWEQPSDWVTVAVNGITAYWVRVRLTALTGTLTNPTQQNRNIYSIVWPYIEIQENDVGGDISALIREFIYTQSAGAQFADLAVGRVVFGLRSVSRGDNFSAYLNAAQEQNNPAINTVFIGIGDTTLDADVTTATGWRATYNPGGFDSMSVRMRWEISAPLSLEYYGAYHAFLRTSQNGGVAGDILVRLRVTINAGTQVIHTSDEVSAAVRVTGSDWHLIDLGRFSAPSTKLANDEINDIWFSIDASNSNGATPGDLYIYDIILIPTDEFIIDTSPDFTLLTQRPLIEDQHLDVDSITIPKTSIRSLAKDNGSGRVRHIWGTLTNSQNIAQTSSRQRIWFVTAGKDGVLAYWRSQSEASESLQLFRNQRYLSLRGNK